MSGLLFTIAFIDLFNSSVSMQVANIFDSINTSNFKRFVPGGPNSNLGSISPIKDSGKEN